MGVLAGVVALTGVVRGEVQAAQPPQESPVTQEQTLSSEAEYQEKLQQIVADLYAAAESSNDLIQNPTDPAVAIELGELLKRTHVEEDTKRVIAQFIDQLMVQGNLEKYKEKRTDPELDSITKGEIERAVQNGTLAEYVLEHESKHFHPGYIIRLALLIQESRAGMQKTADTYNAQLKTEEDWKAVDADNPLTHPQVGQTPSRLQLTLLLEHLEQGNIEMADSQIQLLIKVLTMPDPDFWSYLRSGDAGVQFAGNGLMGYLNATVYDFQWARDGAAWGSKVNQLYDWPTMEQQAAAAQAKETAKQTFTSRPQQYQEALRTVR